MMSAKDFNAMAIEFGLMHKEIDYDSNAVSQAKRFVTLNECIHRFCRVAAASNSAFDRARFEQFVVDVATGVRNAEGKKVKK